MQGIKITATGSFVPPFVATNDDFAQFLDTSDEWIFPRTGIKQRHLNLDKPNFYMAVEAAKNALENGKINPLEVDLIIASTCTPDFLYPNLSCLIQNGIGAKNAATFDLNNACTGFISSVEIAASFLQTGTYKKIMIVASEQLSPHLDYTDRHACILFGDGAGAVVLEKGDKLFASFMGANGENALDASLYYKINYDTNCPFYKGEDFYEGAFNDEEKNKYLQMKGNGVYKFATEAMPVALNQALEEAGWTMDDLDLIIPHQANMRIIEKAAKNGNIPMEKVYVFIQDFANISSACIPTALDELNRAGKLKRGMKIALVGFGAGLTYGAVCFEI